MTRARAIWAVLSAGIAALAPACSEAPAMSAPCAAGTIATASGCSAIPTGPGLDGGRSTRGDAGNFGGGPDSGARSAPDAGPIADADADAEDGPSFPRDAGDAEATSGRPTGPDAASDGGAADRPDAQPTDIDRVRVELEGQWALEIVNADRVTSSMLGTQSVTVTTLLSAEISGSAPNFSVTARACDVTLTPFHGIQTTYPPAAINAIEIHRANAIVPQNQTGSSFSVDQLILLLGWRPNGDAALDTLPVEASDRRVYDADHDGNPGVTLQISGLLSGQIYVVHRGVIALTGTVLSQNRIEGTSRADRAQNILRASTAELATNLAIASDPNGPHSFRMARISRGTSCAAILRMRATLFP